MLFLIKEFHKSHTLIKPIKEIYKFLLLKLFKNYIQIVFS